MRASAFRDINNNDDNNNNSSSDKNCNTRYGSPLLEYRTYQNQPRIFFTSRRHTKRGRCYSHTVCLVVSRTCVRG